MMIKFIAVLSITGIVLVSRASAQCPTLPSGFCFVDCTRSVYRIVCENAAGGSLFKDIVMYNNTSQLIELFIWNSRSLTRLSSTVVTPIANQLVRLDLDNLIALTHFPELRKITTLKQLTIMNSPQLTDLPAELLPPKLESISLHEVGISELVNDFDEVEAANGLTSFSFSAGNLTYIQKNFFFLFPNIRSVRIRNSAFLADHEYGPILTTHGPLDLVEIIQNNMKGVSYELRRHIIEKTFGSIQMAQGGRLDFSDNDLPITELAAHRIRSLTNISFFSIRNNPFEDYITLTHAFVGLDFLEFLDMSGTNMIKSKGMLAGLPSLVELRLANNSFRDLVSMNLFDGCNATNLKVLDLSFNHLRMLPSGLANVSQNLVLLNISNNDIDLRLAQNSIHSSATFKDFPNLLNLDISFNHLSDKSFDGSLLADLKSLQILNISCNNFVRITKDYFNKLPPTLVHLNVSFCKKSESQAPFFEADCLSTLPPKLDTLTIWNGYLRTSVLDMFLNASIPSLRHLDLSYNIITDLPTKEVLYPLRNLKTLRFRYNLMQSVGAFGLATLSSLEELDLSRNEISSIGAQDFGGLLNLRILSLSGNNIVDVDPGALEPLTSLELFYFGKNHFGDIKPIFGSGGKQVRHLGLQYLIAPCLDPALFSQLKKLRWIYVNQSQPIYVDFGSFRTIQDKIAQDPPQPESFRISDMTEQGCEGDYLFIGDTSDPDDTIRVLIQDEKNQVAQHILLTFPICHNKVSRNIRQLVNRLVCTEKVNWDSNGAFFENSNASSWVEPAIQY